MSGIEFGGNGNIDELGEPAGRPDPSDTAAMPLEDQFCSRLHAWDRHMDACSTGLRVGRELCEEGQRIFEMVTLTRTSAESYAARPDFQSPTPNSGLFRRVWIGWASFLAPITGV